MAPAASPRTGTPLAPDTYRLTVSMSGVTRELWDRLREVVDGDDAAVLARVVQAALPVLQRQRLGATTPAPGPATTPLATPAPVTPAPARTAVATPSPATRTPRAAHSRHIPAAVRREVYVRDGGACAFVGWNGHRCGGRRFLQFHHVKPWMAGGEATVENIQLRCRPHNQYEGRLFFDRPTDGRAASVSA